MVTVDINRGEDTKPHIARGAAGSRVSMDAVRRGLPGPAGPPGNAIPYVALARSPDLLITGTVTRDANGAATGRPRDVARRTTGTYTADTVSTSFPGAVDGYHITYGSPVTKTYTQPTITRNSTGAATSCPRDRGDLAMGILDAPAPSRAAASVKSPVATPTGFSWTGAPARRETVRRPARRVHSPLLTRPPTKPPPGSPTTWTS